MARSSLHDVLATGVAEGASDWHIRQDCNVVLRSDNRLVEVAFVPSREFPATAIPEIRFDAINDPPEYPGSVA